MQNRGSAAVDGRGADLAVATILLAHLRANLPSAPDIRTTPDIRTRPAAVRCAVPPPLPRPKTQEIHHRHASTRRNGACKW
jgi:hypothetical protein